MILAIYWLARAGVQHRDISVGNLGWAVRKNGICVGLPFDFDHARFIKRKNPPSSEHITGTIPFMALDLLQNMTRSHIVRYDYESCFWVAWYIATCYKGGKQLHTIKDHPLLYWQARPLTTNRATKMLIFSDPTSYPAPGFGETPLDSTLKKLQGVWSNAAIARITSSIGGPHYPLWKTMDDTITRKHLSAALSEFKGHEERHKTSFLSKLEIQSEEKDNLL